MKSVLENKYLVFPARIILGLAFIAASLDKIVEPSLFAVSITNYKILPSALSLVLATILPWIELLCGLSVLFGVFPRGSSLLMGLLLVVFIAAVSSALIRGLDITCGCFSQDPAASRISWVKLAENSGLLLLSVLLFFSRNATLSLERYIRTRSGDQ